MLPILATCIGIVAGLRAMTAPAAIAWGAYLGWLPLSGTSLAFIGSMWSAVIFSALAVAELITDQLPSTPSRKVPVQFATRVLMGALSGAAFGTVGGSLVIGLIAGAVGAVIGTYGGAEARVRLARKFRRDLPAALIEDIIAIAAVILLVAAVS